VLPIRIRYQYNVDVYALKLAYHNYLFYYITALHQITITIIIIIISSSSSSSIFYFHTTFILYSYYYYYSRSDYFYYYYNFIDSNTVKVNNWTDEWHRSLSKYIALLLITNTARKCRQTETTGTVRLQQTINYVELNYYFVGASEYRAIVCSLSSDKTNAMSVAMTSSGVRTAI